MKNGRIAVTLALALVLAGTALAQGPEEPEPAPRLIQQEAAEALRRGEILLNYENVDIRVLARLMAELTGRNLVLDDRVQGRVTVLSARPVSPSQAWGIFKAALRRYGFVMRDRGEFVQVVPAAEARRTSRVLAPGKPPYDGDQMVLAILILQHANPDVLQNAVRQLVSEVGFVIPYKEGRALIVAERAETVARITELVQSLDRLHPPSHVSVVFPEHLAAKEVVGVLTQVLAGAHPGLKVQAFEPANAVVMFGDTEAILAAKGLLGRLDLPRAAPAPVEPPRFHVYHLQNAQAEKVAEILSQMLQEKKQATAELQQERGAPAQPAEPSQPPAEGPRPDAQRPYPSFTRPQPAGQEERGFISARVSADPETNSLVFYLSPSEYEELKPVIAQLDLPRKQVQISAVVAEVSLRRMLETGANFQVITSGGVLSAFKGGVSEEGLLSFLASGNFLIGAVGGATRTINVGGRDVRVPEAFAFISGLQDDSDFNLISAPRVVTEDHKKAVINVGQVVPFATGARFDTFGQPLVTYDYKEVGIKLEVTPHVSQSNRVRLDLNQEIQEVTDFLRQDLGGFGYVVPVISNRNVKTTITVGNGQTLMIGGLISKRTVEAIQKVPILGDIPLLGNLFRDTSKDEQKTTVFISMTPHIVERPEELPELDRPYERFLRGEMNPGDEQTEDRNTRRPEELLPRVPEEQGLSPTARAAAIRLGRFGFDRPVGPGKVARPMVTVENNGPAPVELVLRGVVIAPGGEETALDEYTVVVRPGKPLSVKLPHYVFPDTEGVYRFQVSARLGDRVVATLDPPGCARIH